MGLPPRISKSHIVRELLADAIRTVRKAGNDRPAVIFVPRIDLAVQQADLLRAVAPDLDVRVWLGRAQQGMCGDLDSIREARARMLDPQQHVCDGCALADGCAYQKQRRQAADVWFVAHPMLYAKPPRALSKACLIWIDESPIDAALVGVGGDDDAERALPLDTLRRCDPITGKPDAADRLHELRIALATPPKSVITLIYVSGWLPAFKAVHGMEVWHNGKVLRISGSNLLDTHRC